MHKSKIDIKFQCLQKLKSRVQLIVTGDGNAFGVFIDDENPTAIRISSSEFLNRIRLIIAENFIPSFHLLIELQQHMEAVALHQSPQKEVHVRFRRGFDKVLIDKSDKSGRGILITPNKVGISNIV